MSLYKLALHSIYTADTGKDKINYTDEVKLI